MTRRVRIVMLLVVWLTGLLLWSMSGPSESIPPESRSVVLVELFTSEGCSSCPPADQVLARLEARQPVAEAKIVVLSQHVDYWNDLGWADPFSSAQFTRRQERYARAFKNRGLYTPQMVVDGHFELVGHREGRALDLIRKAASLPKAAVLVACSRSLESGAGNVLSAQVTVDRLPAVTSGDTAEVWLSLAEDKLVSEVSRGENAGRRLSHSGVVRSLTLLGSMAAAERERFSAEVPVRIAKGWNADNLQVVVFVQEKHSRRVLGVGHAPVPR
ncbi:MAG: DUF1223 domain-containing protein [Acidobacteriota bacterium]